MSRENPFSGRPRKPWIPGIRVERSGTDYYRPEEKRDALREIDEGMIEEDIEEKRKYRKQNKG